MGGVFGAGGREGYGFWSLGFCRWAGGNGREWDGMGWDGMGWDGMGWDGMEKGGFGVGGLGSGGGDRGGLGVRGDGALFSFSLCCWMMRVTRC